MRKGIITLAIANTASKPIGLLRQMVFAMFYGVTAVMSACRFAQTITLAFMNFFATDTLNAGFLPTLSGRTHCQTTFPGWASAPR